MFARFYWVCFLVINLDQIGNWGQGGGGGSWWVSF